MSHRTIDENTRYYIYNQGTDLHMPVLNLLQDASEKTTTIVTAGGNWNFNGTAPKINGSTILPLVDSTTQHIQTVGTTIQIQSFWPRIFGYSVNLNYAGSSAMTDVDWATKTLVLDNFSSAPSPGAGTFFIVNIGGSTVQFGMQAGGVYILDVTWTFGGNLTPTNQATIQIQESTNAGATYAVSAESSLSPPTGGINLPSIHLSKLATFSTNSQGRMKVTVSSTLAFATSVVLLKFLRLSP